MKPWTQKEINILFLDLSLDEMKELLPGRSRASIAAKKSRMNPHKNPPWTLEEIRILRDKYGVSTAAEIEALLPLRSSAAIRRKASLLKIKKGR